MPLHIAQQHELSNSYGRPPAWLAAAEKRGLFRFDPTRVAPIDRLGIEESSRKANIHTNRLLNDHRREVPIISLKVRTNRKAVLD